MTARRGIARRQFAGLALGDLRELLFNRSSEQKCAKVGSKHRGPWQLPASSIRELAERMPHGDNRDLSYRHSMFLAKRGFPVPNNVRR